MSTRLKPFTFSLSHSLTFSLSLLANKNLETKECSYHYHPATQSVNSAYNPNKLMRKMKNKLVNLYFSSLASFCFFCFLVLLCADSKCWNCWNFTSYYQLFLLLHYCIFLCFHLDSRVKILETRVTTASCGAKQLKSWKPKKTENVFFKQGTPAANNKMHVLP